VEALKIIGIVLGSSVLTALVTALFTRKSHEETIALKYITEERAKWREKVKETMAVLNEAIHTPKLNSGRLNKTRKASTYLKLSLNPDPKHSIDRDILECITSLCDKPEYGGFVVLEQKVALLLKHDWERAKIEAKTPVPSAVLFASIIGIVWCVFYFVLSKTSLYSLIQNVPYFSGTYSELALSIGCSVLAVSLLTIGLKKVLGFKALSSILKLNKAIKSQT